MTDSEYLWYHVNTHRQKGSETMLNRTCCDLARPKHKFCGECGTNLELARERGRNKLKKKSKNLVDVCELCGSSYQHGNFCTQCGARMPFLLIFKKHVFENYIEYLFDKSFVIW